MLAAAVLLLAGVAAQASYAQSGHEQIGTAVRDFIESFYPMVDMSDSGSADRRIEIEVSAIDPRLSLTACDRPLQASIPQTQSPVGRINVKVECEGSIPWSKYVPANVRIYQQILVSTRPLARGETLTAADVMLAESEISSMRQSYLQSAAEAVGMELKRSIPAQAVVTQEALALPTLINRGDTVVMSAQAGTVMIRQQGIALQSGELGSQIPVRNTSSDVVVRATVTGPGQAEVIF